MITNSIKKILPIVLGLTTLASPALAHPGRTDSSGGHTCRTNCPSWGLSYGEYHYHNGGGRSTAPVTPIVTVYDRAFRTVFGRYTAPEEYSYWSVRALYEYALTNEATLVAELRIYQKLGYTYGDLDKEQRAYITSGLIPTSLVPRIVEESFLKVYGRKITANESTYWKKRARTDKRKENDLRTAMSADKKQTSGGSTTATTKSTKHSPDVLGAQLWIYDANDKVRCKLINPKEPRTEVIKTLDVVYKCVTGKAITGEERIKWKNIFSTDTTLITRARLATKIFNAVQ